MTWNQQWASLPLARRREMLKEIGESPALGCYVWEKLPLEARKKLKRLPVKDDGWKMFFKE